MAFNTKNGIFVGADVSRTSTMYRPSVAFGRFPLICSTPLSASTKIPIYQIKSYNRHSITYIIGPNR